MKKLSRAVTWLKRRFNGSDVVLARANAARDAGRWAEAAEAYAEYVSLEPRRFGAWVQLGHMRKEASDLSGAVQAYNRAGTIRPEDADLKLSLGHLEKVRGDLGAAVRHYRESVRINGNPHAAAELKRLVADGVIDDGTAAIRTTSDQRSPTSVRGSIDVVEGLEVRGWVIDPLYPDRPATIEFVDHTGNLVGTAVARLDRPDLRSAGYATSVAGFEALLPLALPPGKSATIGARLKRTGEELPNSPFIVTSGHGTVEKHGVSVTAARVAIAKPLTRTRGAEIALFVTHAPDGVVKPHVRLYLEALVAAGVEVVLIVAADRPLLVSDRIEALTVGIVVRQNVGYDFSAWAHAIRLFPEIYDAPILYLLNDSMFGPNRPSELALIFDTIRSDPAQMISLTETHEFAWHLQSYFVALKRELTSSYSFQFFVDDIEMLATKKSVVDTYEIPFARRMELAGFATKALFQVDEPRNPTMHGWRELLRMGFPFVKTLLFREKFAEIDMSSWRELLEEAGFDVPLLTATLKHTGVTGPVVPGFPLLAKPRRRAGGERPPGVLKVALYGPWNYDNGLGFASRSLIAALRRTGVSLSLHPIKKRFHVHQPLSPPFDILDFEGDADVAIVHLNPDSWELLTDEQRGEVARAGKRIGYWVWEMGHLPDAWRRDFQSVDRIWAASGYNAELFRLHSDVPVDVIPHPVPVSLVRRDSAPTETAARLGVPAGGRLILYAFDGSSYLIRKNPGALVRAFRASDLDREGWTLVIKTKHLHDRPEEGAAFERLARGAAGVCLIDRPFSDRDMADLMALADIYASPHCSEGFGLTVAEAMAHGKPVVATDFSGTTQFLDASCGYPVKADRYVLTEDYGHYTKGGEWARIDEDALAAALRHAARDLETGDRHLADAARRRIGDALSFDAVAASITHSLDALWDDDALPRGKFRESLSATIRTGLPAATIRLPEPFTVFPLKPASFQARGGDELSKVRNSRDHWIVFAQEDAFLSPLFAAVVAPMLDARPDVSIFYGDDVATGEDTILEQVRYKPEFGLSLFVAQDFIGAPVIVRGSALHALGGLDTSAGEAILDDLIARAYADGLSIARIPEVLLAYEGKRPRVSATARRTALRKLPLLADYRLEPGMTDETTQLVRPFDEFPAVTLLMPTRRARNEMGQVYIERLLDSLGGTDWPADKLRVLIGDDADGTAFSSSFPVQRLPTPRAEGTPFNYAAKMNTLWRAAQTEHVVFMNDDVVVTEPGWLKALMTFAMDEQVGGVGPRLLYDDGSIQHAGVVGGLFGVAAHAWLRRADSHGSYQDWLLVHREWSMLTGAVFATRRTVLQQVDGFDELFSLEFNDLDLCLRMCAIGLRLVYTPFATMTHSEKASRGKMPVEGEQTARFLRRWRPWLGDDPASHPRLRRDQFDLGPDLRSSEWFV